MNILITGANGQLGNSLRKLSVNIPDHRFIWTDQEELDILDREAIQLCIDENKVDAVINCAAYTAVDKAEEQKDLAFLINETGPANLASACQKNKCLLIHISTDYVFSGQGYRPYPTDYPIDPKSVYAKSKAAGEIAVMNSGASAWIVRTSWLYSEFGHNFVKTMLNLGNTRAELRIVADQIGSPTYAGDLAKALIEILLQNNKGTSHSTKVYHYSNSGCSSWFDFTKAIMEFGRIDCVIKPITTEEYPLPANRPHYSVLDTKEIQNDLKIEIPYWRDSLKECIGILSNQ